MSADMVERDRHLMQAHRAIKATAQAGAELLAERDVVIGHLKLALRLIAEGGPEDPAVIAQRALGWDQGPGDSALVDDQDLSPYGMTRDEEADEAMRRA